MKNRKGFTLIDLLIVLVIGTIPVSLFIGHEEAPAQTTSVPAPAYQSLDTHSVRSVTIIHPDGTTVQVPVRPGQLQWQDTSLVRRIDRHQTEPGPYVLPSTY